MFTAAARQSQQLALTFGRWVFNDAAFVDGIDEDRRDGVDWLRAVPFMLIHLACGFVVVVGVSWTALLVALMAYLVRMFAITGFYHRYFSHRSFEVSRAMRLAMGILGCTAGQRGPLWWAGHHREHHAKSDTAADPHSPSQRGFLYSHTIWFLTRGNFALRTGRVRDWLRYPELVWLEKLDWLPFIGFAFACYALGSWLEEFAPDLDTNGWQLLVWGFFISTVVLYHATYTINSIAHGLGRRRYETPDDSRNNAWLAVITLGEGWHNNHHHYPSSARQGFYWWELDVCFLGLCLMRSLGLARKLKTVPLDVKSSGMVKTRDT